MKNSMTELISLLTEKKLAMEELLLAQMEEQRCIVSLDLNSLQENGLTKEEATDRLAALRSRCGTLMRQAGEELGVPEAPNLSALIAAAGKTVEMQLRPLQQRLLLLGRELERQQDMNCKILQSSLGRVRSSMSMFGRMLEERDTYGARGRISGSMTRGRVLRQEI